MRVFPLLLLLITGAWADESSLWREDFTAPALSGWSVETAGDARAEAVLDPNSPDGSPALRFSSQASGGELRALSTRAFPVHGGEELVLRLRATGHQVGGAFVTVVFQPAGGAARFTLPPGTYAGQTLRYSFLVPPDATEARIAAGVDAPTGALWLDTLRVEAPIFPRSGLQVVWRPRPRETLFPQAAPPAPTLLALDVSKLPPDAVMLAVTLQGLVNRAQPRIYLYFKADDRFWGDWLVQRGCVTAIKELPDLPALIAAFRDQIPGVIVYDPALPASRHAAVMLGAIQGCPATGREMAATLGLPVASDLTGRWKRNVDAYRDLWGKYRNRFESHALAVYDPLMEQEGPRDYLFQQKIFTFWVSDYGDGDAGGDPAAELDFAHEALAATPPNIPLLGAWHSNGRGLAESTGLDLGSSYGKFLAGSAFCTNLSVLSGIHLPPELFRQAVGATMKPAAENGPRVYATLSVLDGGDDLGFWQHDLAALWADPTCAVVPMNWAFNPAGAELMAPVLAWFYQQAPSRGSFCAASGQGVMNPHLYGTRFRAQDRERIWKEYLADLDRTLRAFDLHVLTLNTGDGEEPRQDAHYGRFFSGLPALRGILSNFGRPEETPGVEAVQGKPVFHSVTHWPAAPKADPLATPLRQEQTLIDFTAHQFLDHLPAERPAFLSGTIPSAALRPGIIEQIAAQFPSKVELVDADDIIDLWCLRPPTQP